MPVSTETLLVVLVVATAVNLVLAVALVVVPRLRRRGNRDESPGFSARASAAAAAGSSTSTHPADRRPLMAMFGPGAGAVPSDPQTGLDAPSTWTRWLHEEETRVRRYHRPATVVLVELEGLDRLVERLGPAAADRLIPPVAATMRRHARESDRVARLGPARFGAILPETDEVRAINYVERVRSTCDLWLASGAVSLRLSMGWAEMNASHLLEATLAAAEDRLNAERRRADVGDAIPGAGPDATITRPAPAT
ncbi:MAG TPA: diguanylate cyclase [Candidatus Limnocylindrales bacterium]|nr:diguanylate cyclase [Candidatus Limnocylindrales bacterium]